MHSELCLLVRRTNTVARPRSALSLSQSRRTAARALRDVGPPAADPSQVLQPFLLQFTLQLDLQRQPITHLRASYPVLSCIPPYILAKVHSAVHIPSLLVRYH